MSIWNRIKCEISWDLPIKYTHKTGEIISYIVPTIIRFQVNFLLYGNMKWKALPTLFFLIVYLFKSRKNLPLFIFIKVFGYVLLLFAKKFLTDKLLMASRWKFYCLSLLPTHMTELYWNILKRKKLKHTCQEMKICVITFLPKSFQQDVALKDENRI